MIRRPPRSTQSRSSAASDVYKRQQLLQETEVGLYLIFCAEERFLFFPRFSLLHIKEMYLVMRSSAQDGSGDTDAHPSGAYDPYSLAFHLLFIHACSPHSCFLPRVSSVSYTHLMLPTIY